MSSSLFFRGVINYKTDFTGAVPKPAVEDPFSMGGWINEDYKGWRWQLVNNFNSTVVDLTWAFKANAKGEYNGNGQFLNHVTTVLGDIYAAWGFSVAVEATAGQPYNAGTVGAPIAVQELQVLAIYDILQLLQEALHLWGGNNPFSVPYL